MQQIVQKVRTFRDAPLFNIVVIGVIVEVMVSKKDFK